MPSLFGLAPGGVFHAFFVTKKTGALLPHLFTLALIRRYIFCGTIPEVSLARSYLAPHSYRARTFLSCFSTKATNQLSGYSFINKERVLNQGFFYSFLTRFIAIIKHSLSIIPFINSFL